MKAFVLGIIGLVIISVSGYWLYTTRPSAPIVEEVSRQIDTSQIVTHEAPYFEGATGYFARPEAGNGYPGVVIVHENRGLSEEMKTMAENLAKEGYMVIAADLFGGALFEKDADAQSYIKKLDHATGTANLRAATLYLHQQGARQVAALGFGFGGGEALRLALSGEPLDAMVVYYGDTLPTKTSELAPIRWPVMGVFGTRDRVISVDTAHTFEKALNTLGIENEMHFYPGIGHAFADPSSANYAPEEALDAWQKTVAFLEKYLK